MLGVEVIGLCAVTHGVLSCVLQGVCDDGIDSLRPTFGSICDWIDQARLEGGQVLVHCRVGVSRSATVTVRPVSSYTLPPRR